MPGDGGCSRLSHMVGLGRAMEIILTGKIYDAQEAYRIGFVNHVVPAKDLMTRATQMAEMIAANAPLATRAAKQAVLHSVGRPLVRESRSKRIPLAISAARRTGSPVSRRSSPARGRLSRDDDAVQTKRQRIRHEMKYGNESVGDAGLG